MRALGAEAMKPGNIFAKREYLRRLDQTEAIEFAQRREIFEFWRDHAAQARVRIDRAIAAGEPEPRILPQSPALRLWLYRREVQACTPADRAHRRQSIAIRIRHICPIGPKACPI